MTDTTQNDQQTTVGTTLVQFPTSTQQNPGQDSMSSQVDNQQGEFAPTTPGFNKENEPMSTASNLKEFITPAEQPIELAPEIENIGVQDVSVMQQAHEQKINELVEKAKEPTSNVSSEKAGKMPPLSKTQAQQVVKGSLLFKNASNGLLWFAMLVLRQIQIKEKERNQNEA